MAIKYLSNVDIPVTSSILKTDASGVIVAAVAGTDYLTSINSSMITTALGYTPVPTTRTLTINGTTYDLSANRSWTISTVETDTLATVTTRGNVTTNAIDVGGVKSDYVTLDTAATPTPATGMFSWNTADDTANLQLASGASLQLGQEQHWYVKNSSGSTIPNGTVVRAAGTDGISGHMLVEKMVADGSVEELYVLGIATADIANGGFGHVTSFGKVRGLNTSGFTEGAVLYCDPAVPGGLTATKPTAPNLNIPLAFVISSHATNGVLATRVIPGYHLGELHDVQQTSAATGQLLRYNTNRWENWTPNYLTSINSSMVTTALGYTPVTNARTLTINGTAFDLTANRSWTITDITGTSGGVLKTVTGTTSAELVRGNMGDNDQARILVGATATNAGYLEIATADDGTEPIYVRQYTGVFSTLTRTATLLDGSGNTSFPGTLTASNFSGSSSGTNTGDQTTITGNAGSATVLQTARTLTIGNTGKTFNGSANVSWSLAEIGALGATAKAADSELLDGLDSSSFLRSDAADTATGEILFDAGFKSDAILLNGAQNFDNISRSGFYNLYNTNTGSTNSPGFPYGTMLVVGSNKDGATFGLQLAHERLNTAGGLRVRGMNDTGSTWSAWATVWTSQDFANNSSNWDTAYGWGNHASAGYAPLASPALTGVPTAPTAATATNTIQIATTAFVKAQGYTTNTGTVTSVAGTGGYGGLTLSGTVTTSGNITLGGTPTGTWPISVSGNAATATSATSATIATSAETWTTARTLTIGNTGKSVNGSANASWSIAEIGALALTGGALTGNTSLNNATSLLFNGLADTNWRIGRNIITESGNNLTSNTLQFVAAAATGQGFQFVGSTGTTLLEIDALTGKVFVSTGAVIPSTDRTQNLGDVSFRWDVVYCQTLDSAGLHESNLADDSIGKYNTGVVLVWQNGEMVPCNKFADHMRMGIAVKGNSSPLVQGAEPVLCTGDVAEGQYLVTSETVGHAVGVDRNYVVEHQLFDCVIGRALESGSGESFIVKTWVNI